MKRFRSLLFWLHLIVGVSAGVVILIMSATGVLLTYQRQITAWADARTLIASPAARGAPPLPIAVLLDRAHRGIPTEPTALTWRSDAGAPVEVAFGRERTRFVDAASGTVLGEGSARARAFFRSVTNWHRWLAASAEHRKPARALTGAANLGFLLLVMSGFYLWWPRAWTRAGLRNVTRFRRGLSAKARDFNWHNVIGLWSAVPLFVVVLSGVVISYSWANDLAYRAVGETPPSQGGPAGASAEDRRAPRTPVGDTRAPLPLDTLLAVARRRLPEWRTVTLQLPKASARTATFALDAGTGGQPQARAQLTLDRTSAREVKWEPFASNTRGRRLRSILRFAHTGEVLGVAGQTIAGLASFGGVFLVYTGLMLSLRRFAAWLARRRNAIRIGGRRRDDESMAA